MANKPNYPSGFPNMDAKKTPITGSNAPQDPIDKPGPDPDPQGVPVTSYLTGGGAGQGEDRPYFQHGRQRDNDGAKREYPNAEKWGRATAQERYGRK